VRNAYQLENGSEGGIVGSCGRSALLKKVRKSGVGFDLALIDSELSDSGALSLVRQIKGYSRKCHADHHDADHHHHQRDRPVSAKRVSARW
jgi:hypothetical protein